MNRSIFRLFAIGLAFSSAHANLSKKDMNDFITARVNGTNVVFDLPGLNTTTLQGAIKHLNATVDETVLDPKTANYLLGRLWGLGMHRLDPADRSQINYFLGVDNTASRLLVVDSKNKVTAREKWGCVPDWVPFYGGDCAVDFTYASSKIFVYGKRGSGTAQFDRPEGMATDMGELAGNNSHTWIADGGNNRIVHLQIGSDGKPSWVNTIAGFDEPKDVAFAKGSNYLYVADSKNNSIVRIPAYTSANFSDFRTVPGVVRRYGRSEPDFNGFVRPLAICVGDNGDQGASGDPTLVYVADGYWKKILVFKETGTDWALVNSVDLPEPSRERYRLGMKPDRFGNIFVFDEILGKVHKYSPSLKFLFSAGRPGTASSANDIQFNEPLSGLSTGADLYAVEQWGPTTGLQRFGTDRISLLSGGLNTVDGALEGVSSNTFQYRIQFNSDAYSSWSGTTPSGDFAIDVSSEIGSLPPGSNKITLQIRSAFNPTKIVTRLFTFFNDPNSIRSPRNIKVDANGRRVDVSWSPPARTAGLDGYYVEYRTDGGAWSRSPSLPVGANTFAFYADRDAAGATAEARVISKWTDGFSTFRDAFFSPGDPKVAINGNNLLQIAQGASYVVAYQTQMPIGELVAVQGAAIANDKQMAIGINVIHGIAGTPPEQETYRVDLQPNGKARFVWFYTSGTGHADGGTCGEYDFAPNDIFTLSLEPTSGDGVLYSPFLKIGAVEHSCSRGFYANEDQNFFYDFFFSGTDIGAGLNNGRRTMATTEFVSEGVSTDLRPFGDVSVPSLPGNLDEALKNAFNGDRLLLEAGTHTLAKTVSNDATTPDGDLRTLTIEGAGPSSTRLNLDDPVFFNLAAGADATYSLQGVDLKASNGSTLFKAGSDILGAELFLKDCVVEGADFTAADFTSQNSTSGILVQITSNTFLTPGSAVPTGLIKTASSDFSKIRFMFEDNFVLNSPDAGCFCFQDFASNSGDVCSNGSFDNNSFTVNPVCASCGMSLCSGDNRTDAPISGRKYLNSAFSVTSIDHPAVVLSGTTVDHVRGAVKTIGGRELDQLGAPSVYVSPKPLPRTNPISGQPRLDYLPLDKPGKANLSLKEKGTLTYSARPDFSAATTRTLSGEGSFLEIPVLPNTLLFVKGKNDIGIESATRILSFPGKTILDDEDLGLYYGSKDPADLFTGAATSDAGFGLKAWLSETLPINGDPANGFLRERTESFFEPLPDITGADRIAFYYKKTAPDQFFKILLTGDDGRVHSIQNSPLGGQPGWEVVETPGPLQWNHVSLRFDAEANAGGNRLSKGKLLKFSLWHNSPSGPVTSARAFLLDKVEILEPSRDVLDENDPSTFVGKSGSDGFDGLVEGEGFTGGHSLKIVVKPGNTTSSDSWTGPLPTVQNQKRFTFAYKKIGPLGRVSVKLSIKDPVDNIVRNFEAGEQRNAADMAIQGWNIPWQENTLWHQAILDLAVIKGPGGVPFTGTVGPFGEVVGIELKVDGPAGSGALFDDMRFTSSFPTPAPGATGSVLDAAFEDRSNFSGWALKSMGFDNSQSVVLTYGDNNLLGFEVDDFGDEALVEDKTISSGLELEKEVNITGTALAKTYLRWSEQGSPFGYIRVFVRATDGNEYPLRFSSSSLVFGDREEQVSFGSETGGAFPTATPFSIPLAQTFEKQYSNLVADAVTRIVVGYENPFWSNGFAGHKYGYLSLEQVDDLVLTLNISKPQAARNFSNLIPLEFAANRELQSYGYELIANGVTVKSVPEIQVPPGTLQVASILDVAGLPSESFGPGGELQIKVSARDIFGKPAENSVTVFVDRSPVFLTIYHPSEDETFFTDIPVEIGSSHPLSRLDYVISTQTGNLASGNFDYATAVKFIQESIPVDPSWPDSATILLKLTTDLGVVSQQERILHFRKVKTPLQITIRDNTKSPGNASKLELKVTNQSTETLSGFKLQFWVSRQEAPFNDLAVDPGVLQPCGVRIQVVPYPQNANLQLVEVLFPSDYFLGPGESTADGGLQFGLHFKNGGASVWDISNDWSLHGVTGSFQETSKIAVFDRTGALIYGELPDPAATPQPSGTPPAPLPARTTDGLQALYHFHEGFGKAATDISDVGIPLDLGFSGANVEWIEAGGIRFMTANHNSVLENRTPNPKLFASATNSGQVSLEAWIKPGNLAQTSARILQLSPRDGTLARNWELLQNGNNLEFRLRTTSSLSVSLQTTNNPLSSVSSSYHVVATYKPYSSAMGSGGMRIYVNGVLSASNQESGLLSASGTNSWSPDYTFAIGNRPVVLDKDWQGEYSVVAVYAKALNQAQISNNFSAGAWEPPLPTIKSLGVACEERVLPFYTLGGQQIWREDRSDESHAISMNGIPFDRGLGGAPQADGKYAWMAYDLQDQAKRLGVAGLPYGLTGFGGKQDGSGNVSTVVKTSSQTAMPADNDWINNANGVVERFNSANGAIKPIDVDLSANKWLFVGAKSTLPGGNMLGTFGDLKIHFSDNRDWRSVDIGSVAIAGSFMLNGGTFSIKASGNDIWGSADGFRFTYRTLNGDGQIIARVASLQNTNVWAKAGVMIRESLVPDSKNAAMLVSAASGVTFQRRISTGGASVNTGATGDAPKWVKLVRSGNAFTGYVSNDGISWTQVGSQTISMGAIVYFGLAVTSHTNSASTMAVFDNVGFADPKLMDKGLFYNYYEAAVNALPDFDAMIPAKSGIVEQIDLSQALRDENFIFEFKGFLQIGTQGSYTFYTVSDDGSRLFIDGNMVVDNDNLHGMQERSGTTALTPGYHAIKVQYFNKTGGKGLQVQYQGPGIARQAIPAGVLFHSAQFDYGVDYRYYEGHWSALPDFNSLTPVSIFARNNFKITPLAKADDFGYLFDGYVYLPANGSYTFFLNSDDGSRLYIDGASVVNNDGIHALQERSSTITLSTGFHSIRVAFFEATGSEGLDVKLQGPGIAKMQIPSEMLFGRTFRMAPPVGGCTGASCGKDAAITMGGQNEDHDYALSGVQWFRIPVSQYIQPWVRSITVALDDRDAIGVPMVGSFSFENGASVTLNQYFQSFPIAYSGQAEIYFYLQVPTERHYKVRWWFE